MDPFLTIDQIKELHVELTTNCNAACPMCARNYNGYGVRKTMQLSDWKDGDSELAFNLPNLNRVYFCGTHGDPLASTQLLNAIDVCKRKKIVIEIFTNGSLRSLKYWQQLVSKLDENDLIVFGIDGYETNHLYRQNTDINKIMERLKIACGGSVRTQWDYLVFAHNEHELEKCQELSVSLGVNSFRVKKTARFSDFKFPVHTDKDTISHYLELPKNPKLRHENYIEIMQIDKNKPSNYNIKCMYKKEKKIYINSRLDVYPCCYISDNNENGKINTQPLELHVPINEFSLRSKSWDQILSLNFYTNDLVESFTGSNTIRRCIRTCGVIDREKNQSEVIR